MNTNNALPTDHSKIAATMKFNFHSDAGHGWLAVKNCLVRELGLAGEISEYSYMKGATSYLEEDGDMAKFINAFTLRFGVAPTIVELGSREHSPIRFMPRFKMEV